MKMNERFNEDAEKKRVSEDLTPFLTPNRAEKLLDDLSEVYQRKQELDRQEKEIRNQLLQIMKQNRQQSLYNGHITVKLVPGFNRTVIDRKELYKRFPVAAAACQRQTWVGDFVKVVKNDEC